MRAMPDFMELTIVQRQAVTKKKALHKSARAGKSRILNELVELTTAITPRCPAGSPGPDVVKPRRDWPEDWPTNLISCLPATLAERVCGCYVRRRLGETDVDTERDSALTRHETWVVLFPAAAVKV